MPLPTARGRSGLRLRTPALARRRHEVVVIGGGPAGISAALAAARAGTDVLLVERHGFLGGTSTASMVGPWMAFHAEGRPIVGGIAQEIVDRLVAMGGSTGHQPDPLGVCGSMTPFDTEVLKVLLFEMAHEAGVKVLVHTLTTGIRTSGGAVIAVELANKSGRTRVQARVVVDASGDADVAAWAGVPVASGRPEDGLTQPMTAIYKVAGVDEDELRKYLASNPGECVMGYSLDRYLTLPYLAVSGFFSAVARARASGHLTVHRDRVLLFGLTRRGEVTVNMTRVQALRGHVGEELSAAEQEGYRQIWETFSFLKGTIPGFSHSWLLQTPTQIGIRETRRIQGLYVLTREDVLSGARFDDPVAMGGFPIDIHAPSGAGVDCPQGQGRAYQIPYRCLVSGDVENLLVAGRCLSATFEAHASARITPTCMALGQAAGLAAALAARLRRPVASVPRALLQRALEEGRAILSLEPAETATCPTTEAPTGALPRRSRPRSTPSSRSGRSP